MKALLIIPTYNEIANIKNIITASLSQSPDLYILVIDDNSPDGTAKAVKEMMENEPHINLIERPKKMGLGSAYVQGFKYALNNDYDYVLEMDADFSHNPADLPRLLEAAKKYDVVIGSRYCQGVNIINWPFRRLLISYFASKYVRIITGMPIKDPTSGFKCFRRRVLEAIDLDSILSDGYAFQIEMNFRAWVKG
ncbi:MAG: polyprenol monophosphomannose synthase, partial [Candidatus Syntrophosphaera sp.]|nr:polyprenol monophosphomannose synthase [Candidatus Syntrophosphaera sp.]